MSTIKSSAEHLTLNADGASKDIKFQANGVEKASISSAGVIATNGASLDGAVIINDTGADVDFRVESNGEANMLVVDGGNNAVGIGSAIPDSGRKLHIEGGGTGIGITFKDTAGSQWGFINDANLFKLRRDSSSADHIIVDSTGAVTKPLQPAFHAGGNDGSVNGAGQVIKFDSERFDQNSDYSTSTGIFTAPVTGKYYLQTQVLVANVSNGQRFDLNCITSNVTFTFGSPGRIEVQPGTTWNDSTKYIALGGNTIIEMDAGDTAKIQFGMFGGGAVYTGSSWTYFSGYLAC